MVIEIMKHWEVAVDGIQIFLCLLILFFLVRNHRRNINPYLMNPKSESGQDFNLQVFSQSINQQVELAFTNILEVAANERHKLDKVLQFQPFKNANHSSPEIRVQSLRSHRDDAFQRVKETAGQNEHWTRIQKLATRGMNAKQISEELKTPLGEVELILSLHKSAEN